MAIEGRLIEATRLENWIDGGIHGAEVNGNAPTVNLYDVLAYLDGMPTVDAVEVHRLGKLGRLMMPYKGCPRGHLGARGCFDGDFKALELDPIMDVDGNRWIPVLEEDLHDMKVRVDNTVKLVHGRWIWKDGECFCSVCSEKGEPKYHYESGEVEEYPYCPSCGAKMHLEDKE